MFRRCLAIEETTLSQEDTVLAPTLHELGVFLHESEQQEEAEAL